MKSNPLAYITIDKKKGLIGAVLGFLFLWLLFLFRDVYIAESNKIANGCLMGIPVAIAFGTVGLIRIESRNCWVSIALNVCWSMVSAVAAIFWTMAVVESIAIWRMSLYNFCLNIMFFFACVGIIYAATGKWRLSVNVIAVLQFIVAVINSYVWQFRGREILFSDISAASTALMVIQQYSPAISLRMMIGLSMWVLVLFSQFSLPPDKFIGRGKKRCAAVVTAVSLFALTIWGSGKLTIQTWGSSGSCVNGFYINFIISVRDALIKPPENYSIETVESIECSYAPMHSDMEEENYPNIIVIMNESFADFRVLGDDIRTNQTVTPFMDSLEENAIRGYALASSYGGSTANSEFEFLTGLTMGFLPIGSTPYQQYISENAFSIAWLLENCGYVCSATHPYYKTSWGRITTYPYLGFGESSFIEDYPQENLVRQWVSDQEMYEYIVRKLGEEKSNQPQFVFGVTMQNHGGYGYTGENFTPIIELEGYAQEYPYAEQYLTLLHESDQALEYLLTFLEAYEEDTIVVFFGDHYPGVETGLYNEIHGGSFDTLDEQMLQYKVPFVIWANYDITEKTVECTSLNYLGRYLLEAARIELPEYYQFLADLEKVIPAMNAKGYYSITQNGFVPYDEAQGMEREWLDQYAVIEYNALFDRLNRSDLFFEQYLQNKS